jgi:hypothetical protein
MKLMKLTSSFSLSGILIVNIQTAKRDRDAPISFRDDPILLATSQRSASCAPLTDLRSRRLEAELGM